MKSKVTLLSLISFLFTFAASAQGIENDDMYFNSKDRAKLNATKSSEVSYTASIKKNKKEIVEDEPVNLTDSYSARNVNPEFAARSNSEMAQADNEDYFINNYRYKNASEFNNWNNSFGNRYNSPWYSTNYWGPSINAWNSPYYGSYYDSWGNPWANPYYQSGWSSSFSYYWGSSWNYGWGMNFGYGNWGGSPYCAYNPYYGYRNSIWNSYYGGGYGGGWGYPANIVVIENGNRYGPAYGKRSSRSSQLSREYNNGSSRTSNRGYVDSGNGRPTTGGRISTVPAPRSQSDYYNRGWRNQTNESNTSNSGSGNTNTRSSWENNSRSTWRETNSNSGGSYTPPQSSGGSNSGRSGGSGSSGSSGSSSGSGSRSGGRGH